MSIDALRWAWRQKTGSSTSKIVLVSMADRAGEQHQSWPSIERLHQDTELNRKTILQCIERLESNGFIQDTGKRVGQTRRVKVYRLLGVEGRDDAALKRSQKRNDPKNGTVPDLPVNGPEIGTNNSPEIGPQNPQGNPKGTPTPSAQKRQAPYPDWFERIWQARPPRSGSNSKKQAYGCANARLREGWKIETIEQGLARYCEFCRATGKFNTEKVLQMRTFLGPEDPPYFTYDWQLPADHGHGGGMSGTAQRVTERLRRSEQSRQRSQETTDG